MASKMKQTQISLLQMDVEFGKKEINFSKAELFIAKAISQASQGIPHIICLPELFTTGYDLSNTKIHAEKIPEGQTTRFLKQKATEYSITIIASFIERKDNNYYNTAVVVNEKGELLGKYQKIHLFSLDPMNETRTFTPGGFQNSNTVFKLKHVNLSVLICYDLRFPEISRKITLDGAELLIYLAEFPNPRSRIWSRLLEARAIENQIFVCGTNRVGKDPELTFFGKSVIYTPVGNVLIEGTEKEEVITVELDPVMLRDARSFLPSLEHRKPEYY